MKTAARPCKQVNRQPRCARISRRPRRSTRRADSSRCPSRMQRRSPVSHAAAHRSAQDRGRAGGDSFSSKNDFYQGALAAARASRC